MYKHAKVLAEMIYDTNIYCPVVTQTYANSKKLFTFYKATNFPNNEIYVDETSLFEYF